MFRLLNVDEIDVRVSTISDKGCSLLLYKDARVDMNILDEELGAGNWQRTHEVINGNLFCNIDMWDDDKKCWVRKQDVGTESYTEKEKGQASDSFKRAAFNIGIGRELYTGPFIWIPSSKVAITEKNGKKMTYDKFEVSEIEYDEKRNIAALTIINQKGEAVFEWRKFNRIAPANLITESCEDCGKEIKSTKIKNGQIWDAEQIVNYSLARYEKVLCPACQKKAEAEIGKTQ